MAARYEIEITPTRDDLLNLVENADEVVLALSAPGRRFFGPNGEHVAAATIQATWRRHIARKIYLVYRKKRLVYCVYINRGYQLIIVAYIQLKYYVIRWAAGVIAISWVMHVRMTRMRNQLNNIRQMHLENFRARSKV